MASRIVSLFQNSGLPASVIARSVTVSSVLDGDSRQHGKRHLVDGLPETCWNTAESHDQWMIVDLARLSRSMKRGEVDDDYSSDESYSTASDESSGDEGSGTLAAAIVSEVRIVFQGGFVGKVGSISSLDERTGAERPWEKIMDIFPENTNAEQHFSVATAHPSKRCCTKLKVSFDGSTDFVGRITIYSLDVRGSWLDE